MELQMTAPCLLGLEGLVAEELRQMDAREVTAENGRVFFNGDQAMLARANINSRFAERILIVLDRFTAVTFEELFQAVRRLPWSEFIGSTDTFPVKGYSISSTLHSVPDCQKIIKKAVVESLKEDYHISWFDETGPVHQIQFSILKDQVTIMLDTTGTGLHKRGYRPESNAAPIRETLAAALCSLSRLRHYHTLYDPFCGSGTILIEGAMLAANVAPGINRNFACDRWGFVPEAAWKQERARAATVGQHRHPRLRHRPLPACRAGQPAGAGPRRVGGAALGGRLHRRLGGDRRRLRRAVNESKNHHPGAKNGSPRQSRGDPFCYFFSPQPEQLPVQPEQPPAQPPEQQPPFFFRLCQARYAPTRESATAVRIKISAKIIKAVLQSEIRTRPRPRPRRTGPPLPRW